MDSGELAEEELDLFDWEWLLLEDLGWSISAGPSVSRDRGDSAQRETRNESRIF